MFYTHRFLSQLFFTGKIVIVEGVDDAGNAHSYRVAMDRLLDKIKSYNALVYVDSADSDFVLTITAIKEDPQVKILQQQIDAYFNMRNDSPSDDYIEKRNLYILYKQVYADSLFELQKLFKDFSYQQQRRSLIKGGIAGCLAFLMTAWVAPSTDISVAQEIHVGLIVGLFMAVLDYNLVRAPVVRRNSILKLLF
jgi:hypothetical protein